MTLEVVRAPDERFAAIAEYRYAPRYHEWVEPGGAPLRMHYIDEGQGPVVLLLHGQPMWGWLYHGFVPRLVGAGLRCVVPDYIGFGKSDQVVGDAWYVIERHCESIRSLVDALDLEDVTLVVHDWGGPIGLRQAVDAPGRFARLVIMNTWLHHVDMEYSPAIRAYNARMAQLEPDKGDLFEGTPLRGRGAPEALARAVAAPFPDASHMGGARRFPLLHPYAKPVEGNAADQARCYAYLRAWPKPAHVIFSTSDPVFPPEWGRRWARSFPFGTFDAVATQPPHHFLQLSAADRIVDLMLGYMR